MTFRFLWGVGANDPGPVKNVYPPIHAGDPEWRDYFTVNLLNLPNHYHNGGIWPFIGGLWVRYIHKLKYRDIARRELVKLARLCSLGISNEWEFNEWHHGVTGRPMGKAYQAWSAASFIRACHDLHVEPSSMNRI
jgi:glycogen debranching enzyme